MHNLTPILEMIRQLPKNEQKDLVQRINIGLEDSEDSVAQLLEVRQAHQEKEEFNCPHC